MFRILFFLTLLTLSQNSYSSDCYRVVTSSSGLNVRNSASGTRCGGVSRGQNLFPAGECVGGWCPITFNRKSCAGVGWVKAEADDKSKKYIQECEADPENIMNMPDHEVARFAGTGNCYEVTSSRSLAIRTAPGGKSCDYVSKGTNLVPKGACDGRWCPVEFSEGACKGTGYVSRGQFHNKYIKPCDVEVSSPTTRVDSGVSPTVTISTRSVPVVEESDRQELASGDSEIATPQYTPLTNNYSEANGSLNFIQRCNSSSCRKASNRGYNINKYDGCAGDLTIGKREKCDSSTYMSEGLKSAVTDNLNSCVKSISKSLGYGDIKKIHINSYGCFNYRTKRGGSSLSEHGKGTAMDIAGIYVTNEKGIKKYISFHEKDYKKDGEFYDKFNACWSDMGASCSCTLTHNKSRSSRMRALHDDHMHITYNCKRGRSC
jgi:hypothetical protein